MEEHSLAQKLAAEFVGTALLVFIGAGSVPAMIFLTSEGSPFSGAELGMIAFAFGLIVVAMVYTIGKVSGCHINPAVTFALAATKRFPWRTVPHYWTAQVAGGDRRRARDLGVVREPGVRLRRRLRRRRLQPRRHELGSAMFVEGLATAILLFTILGIVDTRSPGGVGGTRDRPRDRRDHHYGGPNHERVDQSRLARSALSSSPT